MATESNPNEIVLDGAGVSITIKGDDKVDWGTLLPLIYGSWSSMADKAHALRLEEIAAEQGGRNGPASAGFIQEGAPEYRNQYLPGGTGVRP